VLFRSIDGEFDYVLIDCPPSLGVLTINALCASSEVFIPLQPHFLALQGLGKLLDETIRLVVKRVNPALRVTGVLFTMFDAGTKLAGEVVDDVKRFFESARGTETPWSEAVVFDAVIRRNIKLAEAPSYGLTIFDYEGRSNGALDYARLAVEVLGMEGGRASAGGASEARDQAVTHLKIRGPVSRPDATAGESPGVAHIA